MIKCEWVGLIKIIKLDFLNDLDNTQFLRYPKVEYYISIDKIIEVGSLD